MSQGLLTVKFDKDGLTKECPLYGFTLIQRCEKCKYHGKEVGFQVYCAAMLDKTWLALFWEVRSGKEEN